MRETGDGVPLLFLHGGWGYDVYSFHDVAADLAPYGFRIIAPDRVGYGRSSALSDQPLDFHRRAATESAQLLDALGIDRAVLWGHSDGAVIAAWMALAAPERYLGIVLESLHLWSNKPRSTPFFQSMADGTGTLGARTRTALLEDHGPRWQDVVRMNARAWVRLAQTSPPRHDLYAGALRNINVPALVLHGSDDPRTEPDEVDEMCASLPQHELVLVAGKHAPHAEPGAWKQARDKTVSFLRKVAGTLN